MTLITALYAASLMIIFLYLSFNVVKMRKKYEVGIGDGDNAELQRAIRVHANFNEYVPVIIILFAILELNGTSDLMIHALGTILVIGRILHAWGLSVTDGISKPRFFGVIFTWLVLAVSSALLLANFFGYIF